jgi:hypothetical protein
VTFSKDSYFEKYDPENRFDREKLNDHLKRRAVYVIDRAVTRTGMTRIEYAGFRLELERPTELPEAVAQTLVNSKRNIYFTRLDPSAAPPTRLYATVDFDDFYNRWCQKVTEAEEEFGYGTLLGATEDIDAPCGPEKANCADVVLLDTNLYNNAEIASSFPASYRPLGAGHLGAPALKCLTSLDKAKHHGTYLAGLIGSAKNKAGFWGVHSSAVLVPQRWDSRSADSIAAALSERDRSQTRKQLYVFAGNWEPESRYATGMFLTDEAHRLKPPMAVALNEMDGLWIVAAGQDAGADGRPLRINKLLKYGPMNLGDIRNVLVVTGCERCGQDSTLWSKANYFAQTFPASPPMVHVAAPAAGIPGIANDDQYVKADGTSPATALVAGLASAFIAKYGDALRKPEWVKQWLQYTSTPSLSDEDAARVATGVVNARVAMRDPTKSWLDSSEPGWNGLREIQILGWCQPNAFEMGTRGRSGFEPLDHYAHVNTKRLFRIVRDARTGATGTRWFVYAQYPDREAEKFPGDVLRIGPATFREGDRPLLKTQSGVLRPSQIEDLLVGRQSTPRPLVPCR